MKGYFVVGFEFGFMGLAADFFACACLANAKAFSRSAALSSLSASRSAMTSRKLVSLSTSGLSFARNLSGSKISILSWSVYNSLCRAFCTIDG